MKRRDFIKYGATLAGVGGACVIFNGSTCLIGKADGINNTMDTRPCRIPFETVEILQNGNAYPCVNDFLKYKEYEGNIANNSLDEIWNGKLHTDLRQRILNGDFSMCNRNICVYQPCDKENISPDYKKGPKELQLSYDFECNYHCITCRDYVKINSPEEMKLYDEVYLPKIVELARNSEIVNLLGSGDPMFSRHARKLMTTLVKKYPKIKFNICTNGFLLNEKNINELGIQNNIHGVFISVDAVNRDTYRNILRTDGFDIVMENVKLMSEWKKQGKIEWMTINFVTHIMNYKEMPEFAKLAQKLDVMALFTVYRPWKSAEYYKKYDEVAVFEPKNKHYKELVKILKDPVFKDKEHCYFDQWLANIVFT